MAGFRGASTQPEAPDVGKPRLGALAAAVAFFGACFTFPSLGVEAHSPFLFGLGNLPSDFVQSLGFVSNIFALRFALLLQIFTFCSRFCLLCVTLFMYKFISRIIHQVMHSEPENSLSIPTWAIHFSSVFEFLFAMDIIWKYSEVTGNEKWKGLTMGMLPLHASGIAACSYHFFYNPSNLQGLVSFQAGLTLLGNLTVAIAAYRIASSNGWTLQELNPFPKSNTNPAGIISEQMAAVPLKYVESTESQAVLVAKLVGLTAATSYLVKYGELALDVPFEANGLVATAVVLTPPAITAATYINRGKEEGGEGFSFPSFGSGEDGEGLSMTDVKKYGVSGTVAYVLTELAFWAVAFPVASTVYYNTAGHWPDVINDSADRATVLGFVFAGANIARLAVPLRLGVAIALAPWVDENIINRGDTDQE